ncbi:MAG: hemolysin family protein [Prevotellaceae bacterium]|jgi:CBS domain containing-hemolysin-like protein|nr:hemolysin family protein [Prevotellaceae bacterium]
MNSFFIVIILISLLLSAFFSGMEIAFVSSNKLRLELDKKQKKFYTKITDVFIRNSSDYISTMLVGNNIALVIYGIAFAAIIDNPVRTLLATESDMLVLAIQTVISTLIVLVTAEFLPKSLCKMNPNGILKTFAIPVFALYVLLYPVSIFTSWLARMILRLFGIKIKKGVKKTVFNRSDLFKLTTEVESVEQNNENDILIFRNALDFPEVKVRECMIPRTEIEAIEENAPFDCLKQKFIKSGYSRIPVYCETVDNITGYVNSKDLFKATSDFTSIIRPIQFVPETMQAEKLLKTFIIGHQSLAVVVDEFGGTSGLISIEDILEEILGEIDDEHDTDEMTEKKIDDKVFVFSGRLEVEHLNNIYNLKIPESEQYETLAGYILHENENIPQQKEIITIGDFKIKILRMSGSRIDLVHLTKMN